MPQVVGVGLRYLKTLWFETNGTEPSEGDVVIVKTERGEEMGVVREEMREIDASELEEELTSVIRIATQEDLEYALELGEKEKEALEPFRELIAKNELDMKPIDIEYLFGGDKIVFYFTSEHRVDFRQLVKDLANHFHQRIDMRQMGSRDQARMVGGLGRCGDELCCSRFSGDFEPVSIRMAKAQGLPPNPTKISGACGRLMCCLRYEVDAYQDFAKRAPKKGAVIQTPKGDGEVIELDALREIVKLRFKNEEDIRADILDVPLSLISCKLGKKCQGHGVDGTCCGTPGDSAEGPKPCEITKKAFAELDTADAIDDALTLLPITYKDSGDKTAKKSRKRRAGESGAADEATLPARKERKRGGRRRSKQSKEAPATVEGTTSRTSGKGAGSGQKKSETGAQESKQSRQQRKRKPRKDRPNTERTNETRRAAVASKGTAGTEANAKEAKRVPRRRSR